MTEKRKPFFIFSGGNRQISPPGAYTVMGGIIMDQLDREAAVRVWQRVQSREPAEGIPNDPAALIRQAHALTGLYLGLRRMLTGKPGERCGALYRSQKQSLDCLRGIVRMEEAPPCLPPMDTGTGSALQRLRSCVHRELRLWDGLSGLTAGGDFAPVYARLCRQSTERCCAVLELLGSQDSVFSGG